MFRNKLKRQNIFFSLNCTGIRTDGVNTTNTMSSPKEKFQEENDCLNVVQLKSVLGEWSKKFKRCNFKPLGSLCVYVCVKKQTEYLIIIRFFNHLVKATRMMCWSKVIFINQMKSYCFTRKQCLQLSLWQLCSVLISSIISTSPKIAEGFSWDLFLGTILFNLIINDNNIFLAWIIICMTMIPLFKQIIITHYNSIYCMTITNHSYGLFKVN